MRVDTANVCVRDGNQYPWLIGVGGWLSCICMAFVFAGPSLGFMFDEMAIPCVYSLIEGMSCIELSSWPSSIELIPMRRGSHLFCLENLFNRFRCEYGSTG